MVDPTPEAVVTALIANLFSSAEAAVLLYAADSITVSVDKMAEGWGQLAEGIRSGVPRTASVMINKAEDDDALQFVFMGWNDG